MHRIKTEFPHAILEIENTWIEVADGTRLAARIWLPVDADRRPLPALLEYIPYRKNDGTPIRDAIRHPYLNRARFASQSPLPRAGRENRSGGEEESRHAAQGSCSTRTRPPRQARLQSR